jgi:hypothetical protein
MIERLKKALIDSYVGAITIGWMISDAGLKIATALALPILTWFRHHLVSETFGVKPSHEPIEWQLLIPGLISAVILLAFGYGLLRWLYFAEPKPVQEEPEAGEPADSADSAAL